MKKVKSLLKKIRINIKKIIHLVDYYFFFNLISIKYFITFIIRRYILSEVTWSFFYFAFVISVSLLINRFINGTLLVANTFSYFTATGAMLGGILAIVFTLNTFMMQNAADNSSAGFYKTLGKDNYQDLTYFLIAITSVSLFSFSFISDKNKFYFLGKEYLWLDLAFSSSIILIGLVFYLIYQLYKRVFERIQPLSSIQIIQKKAIGELNQIEKDAKAIAKLISKNPKIKQKKNIILASTFQRMNVRITALNENLDYLFDYHDKLLSRQEKHTAIQVLYVLKNIVERFFSIRKESSIIIPTQLLFATTSDLQSFLQPNLEKLKLVGEDYAQNNDNSGITNVTWLFYYIANSSTQIKFINPLPNEHPVFGQCTGYFNQLVDSLIKIGSEEGLFQSAIIYGKLGLISINKGLVHELHQFYEQLSKIASYANIKRQDNILGEVIGSYNLILDKLISEESIDYRLEFEQLLTKFREVILLSFISFNTGYRRDTYTTQTTLTSPFVLIRDKSRLIVSAANRTRARAKKIKLQYAFIHIEDEFRQFLRQLAEDMHSADNILISTFADSISFFGQSLLSLSQERSWINHKSTLISDATAYLYMPYWFISSAQKIETNHNFDQLINTVSIITIEALKINQDDIVIKGIEDLYKIANLMFQKDTEDYCSSSSGIMECICQIGILAFKMQKTNVLTLVKKTFIDYMQIYPTKCLTNAPDLSSLPLRYTNPLQDYIARLSRARSERRGLLHILDNSEGRLLSEVTDDDIKLFYKEIWNVELG